jgi:hypothetical protein
MNAPYDARSALLWANFGNEGRPTRQVWGCLRKQKDQASEVYRTKDDLAAALGCLGTVTGDIGKRRRRPLAPLHPVRPTGPVHPFRSQRPRQS